MTNTDGLITAVILTSPIPSHPDASVFFETYRSVTERLPGGPVMVLADGVREEQIERGQHYFEYLNDLPGFLHEQDMLVVNQTHRHQSGMLWRALGHDPHARYAHIVETPWLLFMEHDTPLVGEIPWIDLIRQANHAHLNSIRFLHEAAVHPEHEHLFGKRVLGPVPLRHTVQFSARPHLARTDWYRQLMRRYFTAESRTFIEDITHGPAQAPGAEWGMAAYVPSGDAKRSTHIDGRASDPKFPQYDAKVGRWL